jgi:hypothetical protein
LQCIAVNTFDMLSARLVNNLHKII